MTITQRRKILRYTSRRRDGSISGRVYSRSGSNNSITSALQAFAGTLGNILEVAYYVLLLISSTEE